MKNDARIDFATTEEKRKEIKSDAINLSLFTNQYLLLSHHVFKTIRYNAFKQKIPPKEIPEFIKQFIRTQDFEEQLQLYAQKWKEEK